MYIANGKLLYFLLCYGFVVYKRWNNWHCCAFWSFFCNS